MSSGKHFHNVLCLSEAKGMDIMMKIAIFYQKESKLLDDIRKKIRKEACQLDNIYAIYEYSTIKALRKANE